MKKLYQSILGVIIIMLFMLPLPVQAAKETIFGDTDFSGGVSGSTGGGQAQKDPTQNPEAYKPDSQTGTSKVEQIGNKIVGAINVIGIIVSVTALGIIGIRYMLGSVEEKAEYKQTMGPYIIGAILVFATTTVVNVIYQFASGL